MDLCKSPMNQTGCQKLRAFARQTGVVVSSSPHCSATASYPVLGLRANISCIGCNLVEGISHQIYSTKQIDQHFNQLKQRPHCPATKERCCCKGGRFQANQPISYCSKTYFQNAGYKTFYWARQFGVQGSKCFIKRRAYKIIFYTPTTSSRNYSKKTNPLLEAWHCLSFWLRGAAKCWNISEWSASPHQFKLLDLTGRCMQLNMMSKPEVSSLNHG